MAIFQTRERPSWTEERRKVKCTATEKESFFAHTFFDSQRSSMRHARTNTTALNRPVGECVSLSISLAQRVSAAASAPDASSKSASARTMTPIGASMPPIIRQAIQVGSQTERSGTQRDVYR